MMLSVIMITSQAQLKSPEALTIDTNYANVSTNIRTYSAGMVRLSPRPN